MKDKYRTCNESFEIYITRKIRKIKSNKHFNTISTKEKIFIRNAFKAGWEYRKWLEKVIRDDTI